MEVESSCTRKESSSATSKESLCNECQSSKPIYQCPGCLVRTCSLGCCRDHKNRTGCSGKRQRGNFLPVCRMTDRSLRSDFFFLEEVLEQLPRNRRRPRTQETSTSQQKGKKLRRLVQQAENRGITLQIMPSMMVRHMSNSSWYCGPRDAITWKVEVVVHPSKTIVSLNISENEKNIMDQIVRHCEKSGIEMFPGRYILLITRLPAPAKNPRYVEISSDDSLKSALQGMTIVEHPTIHCVPNDIRDKFPTDSDKIIEITKDEI